MVGGRSGEIEGFPSGLVEQVVSRLERAVEHRFRRGRYGTETVENVLADSEADPELCLNVIDALLALMKEGHFAVLAPRLAVILDEAGSLFTVSASNGPPSLQERVNESMREVANVVTDEDTRPAAHLRSAWTAAFARGNQERASEAHREAVRAVEAALRSLSAPTTNGRPWAPWFATSNKLCRISAFAWAVCPATRRLKPSLNISISFGKVNRIAMVRTTRTLQSV